MQSRVQMALAIFSWTAWQSIRAQPMAIARDAREKFARLTEAFPGCRRLRSYSLSGWPSKSGDAAFSKAFKRVLGVAPKEYRRNVAAVRSGCNSAHWDLRS